ncbi:MAG: NAD-dependent epimerase/dehydratase family protein, partial [Alteromonadales bacterium]|nr:NAD-dependent epimerase/dehydratase family protein [Alteromonadales bacterium]
MNDKYHNCVQLNEQEALTKAAGELAVQVKHVFVTGAGGFLGLAICRLLRSADIKVTGFARGNYPELSQMGVNMVQGDISDFEQVKSAMQSCDLVFHVAAKAGVWGSFDDYYKPNVQGAQNIVKACQELAIERLVYTSTPSVTFAGIDEAGIDETQPYAENYLNYYGQTKAQAEQLVLAAAKRNSQKGFTKESAGEKGKLKTVALRPHLIWGPNDP